MPENAVFISSLKNLDLVSASHTRLYFGVEFCERLIPSREELSCALAFAHKNKKDFTFVTPFVTDAGIKKLAPLLDHLASKASAAEIVVNDWGLLNILKERSWQGPIALGRLLTKQKRGPRIMNILDKLPQGAVEHFRQSNVDVPVLAGFLSRNGVSRVELDNLLQGISRPDPALRGSLYYPYAYVTVTRYCLAAFSKNRAGSLRSIPECRKECQEMEFELSHPGMPVKLLLKGNTQFFENAVLPENLDLLNIDRLVFQPKIPL